MDIFCEGTSVRTIYCKFSCSKTAQNVANLLNMQSFRVPHELMNVSKLLMKFCELKCLRIYCIFNELTKLVVLTVLFAYIQAVTLPGTLENQHNL